MMAMLSPLPPELSGGQEVDRSGQPEEHAWHVVAPADELNVFTEQLAHCEVPDEDAYMPG